LYNGLIQEVRSMMDCGGIRDDAGLGRDGDRSGWVIAGDDKKADSSTTTYS
jgi:hypothetical protein